MIKNKTKKIMPTGKHFDLRVYDDVITDKVGTPDMLKKARTIKLWAKIFPKPEK